MFIIKYHITSDPSIFRSKFHSKKAYLNSNYIQYPNHGKKSIFLSKRTSAAVGRFRNRNRTFEKTPVSAESVHSIMEKMAIIVKTANTQNGKNHSECLH